MSGDKLKRVKAVKKWLEKAEDSYSSHEDITGELNLIMAKAEMQRLDETHPHARLKKWGMRGCALAAALLVFGGISWVASPSGEPKVDPLVPVEVVVNNSPRPQEMPQAEEPAPAVETAGPVQTVSASQVEVRETPAPQPAPVVTTPPPAPAAPALSASEIQSVVGEAGRALRGEP